MLFSEQKFPFLFCNLFTKHAPYVRATNWFFIACRHIGVLSNFNRAIKMHNSVCKHCNLNELLYLLQCQKQAKHSSTSATHHIEKVPFLNIYLVVWAKREDMKYTCKVVTELHATGVWILYCTRTIIVTLHVLLLFPTEKMFIANIM